ncbi:ParA family protein [Caballeronia sp. LZ033]|uniref:ParA family protein n=1 Tax=Caballeronia sp. LZ033 TaxID=3038566 RepID=UPI002861E410|nr:ParA family protein [Caballeronia sp. LZ033]MDR5818781.1 ParA family protein [Caballeronia sp. LZ033]
MNASAVSTLPLVSWVDVARRLSVVPVRGASHGSELAPPKGLIASEVFWTGLTLTVEAEADIAEVRHWLALNFRSWYVVDGTSESIRLQGPLSRERLPVRYEVTNASGRTFPFRPYASLDGTRAYSISFPERNEASPAVVAFHSVKGGVGRTTSAMALTEHLSSLPGSKPILFIDADFEAPGVSYLYRTRKPEANVSLEDLLALAHADVSKDLNDTVDYAAREMLDQKIGNVYVLPVKRLLDDLTGFAIRPEHLVTARKNQPYLMVDLVRALTRALDCELAVVDLRAGLVDVALHFLTDPTVERIFVTTASGQAINALQAMLRTIGLIERQTGQRGRQPFVLINQVPRLLYENREFRGELQKRLDDKAEQEFLPILSAEETNGGTNVTPSHESALAFGFAPHMSELVASTDDWESFAADLRITGFTAGLVAEMDGWLTSRSAIMASQVTKTSFLVPADRHDEACKKLAQFAGTMEFAETAAVLERPMLTPPLQRLFADFIRHVPIAVVEGTKGTGKTLTFRYLLQHGSWASAASSMDLTDSSTFNGVFLPVLGSVGSSETMLELVHKTRADFSQAVDGNAPERVSETIKAIHDGIASAYKVNEWTELWLSLIGRAAGFASWKLFISAVAQLNVQPIALFEGLEEILTNPFTDVVHADALRSLLREVPLRLREEAGRPVGTLIFARSDMVEAVIEQNLQQFRSSYRNYALTWLDLDIQELVVWLAAKSEAIPDLWVPEWRSKPEADRDAGLKTIWGLKLGADSSKEARSTEWVIAVLTDLTGRLTARDLVRFIKQAAFDSVGSKPEDRLLTPNAMRKAVEYTSRAKVGEYPNEVQELKPIFDKLRTLQEMTTPFDRAEAAALGIESRELDLLEKYGVAYADEGSFEVPELFRIGLGMKRKGARPNIISLTRKARERAKA